jgi:hypothetical protein
MRRFIGAIRAWSPGRIRLTLFFIVAGAGAVCAAWGVVVADDPEIVRHVGKAAGVTFGPLLVEMIAFWFAGAKASSTVDDEEFYRRLVALTIVVGYALVGTVALIVYGAGGGVDLMYDLQRYFMVAPAAVIAYYFAKSEDTKPARSEA